MPHIGRGRITLHGQMVSFGARRSGKSAKKRMLIIVNPYATTVSDRLRNLVVYALQGRYDVEAVATEAQNHATEIGREARDGGYDVVVSFGGDGTLNEVANGLAGTDMPMAILPGGSANVVARSLGIPNDVVDATEHLLSLADDWEPRKIDLGRVDERRFVFACGAGIDATVVKRVDAHPKLKARARPLVLQLVRRLGLLPELPGQPGAAAGEGRRAAAGRGRHRDHPELRPLHLLLDQTGLRQRGHRDRRRHALDGGAEAGRAARHADPAPAPLHAAQAGRRATARSSASRASPWRRSSRSPRTAPAPPAASSCRSTATTSASAPASSWASTPAP